MVPTVTARLVDDEAAAVTEVLRPWRQNFATVEVTDDSQSGKPADRLWSRQQRLPDGESRGRRSAPTPGRSPTPYPPRHRPLSPRLPMSDRLEEAILVKTALMWACVVVLSVSANAGEGR